MNSAQAGYPSPGGVTVGKRISARVSSTSSSRRSSMVLNKASVASLDIAVPMVILIRVPGPRKHGAFARTAPKFRQTQFVVHAGQRRVERSAVRIRCAPELQHLLGDGCPPALDGGIQ